VPAITPTWTPIPPPTHTPTPVYEYGVLLVAADGAAKSCAAGSTCVAGLLLTNTGNTIDSFKVNFVQRGSWPSQLCRQDGVCSTERLSLVNVGQANTAYITLKVDLPSDAQPGAGMSYVVQAVSDGSRGSAASGQLSIQVQAQ
jgi:hypothetical protein